MELITTQTSHSYSIEIDTSQNESSKIDYFQYGINNPTFRVISG
jgi:hypothetical protein